MSRLRGDVLMAASVPVLLVAGVLPWQRDRICTMTGCGTVRATAWNGSPGWTLPLLAGIALAGLWVLPLPSRPVRTGIAALTAAVAAVGALVLIASLDAVVFGRTGLFHFALPVREEFPVLSVRPGSGLLLGLLGLLVQAVAGWTTVRARGALVTQLPGRAPGARGPAPAAGRQPLGLAQGPPAPRSPARSGRPPSGRRRAGSRRH